MRPASKRGVVSKVEEPEEEEEQRSEEKIRFLGHPGPTARLHRQDLVAEWKKRPDLAERAAAAAAAAERAFEKQSMKAEQAGGVDETRRDAPAPGLSRKNDKALEPEGSRAAPRAVAAPVAVRDGNDAPRVPMVEVLVDRAWFLAPVSI